MQKGFSVVFGLLGCAAMFVPACSSASGGNQVNGGAGGTGNSAGFGAFGSGGGISGGGGTGGGLPPGCASEKYTGELVPADMYVMLDRSASMKDAGKWGAVTKAINDFVALPNLSKLGMGIAFFPTSPAAVPSLPTPCASDGECGAYGPCVPILNECNGALAPSDSCVASDYAKPVVPIADLPGVGPAISSAVVGQSAEGDSTPAAPALEGAISYAQSWAAQHTDRITIVVLATDGAPTNCNPNRVETVAAWAEEGLKGTPSVKTFVIGVGQNLGTLDLIAQKGGTTKATLVSTANAAQEFQAALDKIRGAVGCQYLIPKPQSGDPDYNKVNVAFTPKGGGQELYPQVGSAAECVGKKAWYYDNPGTPSQIILCPAACDQVENTQGGGETEVVLGCQTVVR